MFRSTLWISSMSACLLLALTACEQEMKTYRLAKVDASLTPSINESSADLSWMKPEGWTYLPASGMRLCTYIVEETPIEDLDISVTRLPGAVGNMVDNVNRWRGQIQLDPWSVEEVNQHLMQLPWSEDFEAIQVISIGEDEPESTKSMLVAVVPLGKEKYFFKVVGEKGPVSLQRNAFLQLVQTITKVDS